MSKVRRLAEGARRLYGEVVRGRTRVRVVSEAAEESTTTPRFLLAPYRSGTTLMRYCLDSHPEVAVPPETDFLAPLSSVLEDEPSMTGLSDLGYQRADVAERLGGFARRFYDTYASGRGVDNWVDKSPRYAERPFALLDLFPDARFVVLHRHPLDQINSFTRGGTFAHPALPTAETGRELILAAAAYWRDVMDGLLKFRVDHPDQTIVVSYEQLCKQPHHVLSTVLSHLEVEWSDRVVDYHKYEHDLGREAGRVAGTKGFSLSSGGWIKWPAAWQIEAWETCQDVAERVGYSRPAELGDHASD